MSYGSISREAHACMAKAMNRLGDVRSQRARLSAMKTALENQLTNMEGTREREQAGVDSLNEQVAEAKQRMEEEENEKAKLQQLGADLGLEDFLE